MSYGIKVYATTFEAYELDEPVFKVEGFDGTTATVTISCPVNVESWKEISQKVEECLVAMDLGG